MADKCLSRYAVPKHTVELQYEGIHLARPDRDGTEILYSILYAVAEPNIITNLHSSAR